MFLMKARKAHLSNGYMKAIEPAALRATLKALRVRPAIDRNEVEGLKAALYRRRNLPKLSVFDKTKPGAVIHRNYSTRCYDASGGSAEASEHHWILEEGCGLRRERDPKPHHCEKCRDRDG